LLLRAPGADGITEMVLEDGFAETLLAAQAGGDWAWRELYEDVAPALARYARASGVADPEDLVGDVFLRAVRTLERFDGGRREFRAWMFAIARNAMVDEARKRVRHRTEPLPAHVLAEIGPVGDAEDEAMRAVTESSVRSAMAALTPDQRDVLLLRILGDLTVDEVASVIGKRPGAVKALQARGLERIRRNIGTGAVTF
jgi:RNA polymerase sigma-70 factor (ECF subfamily)